MWKNNELFFFFRFRCFTFDFVLAAYARYFIAIALCVLVGICSWRFSVLISRFFSLWMCRADFFNTQSSRALFNCWFLFVFHFFVYVCNFFLSHFFFFVSSKHHLFYWFWYMDDDRHKQFIIQLNLCSIQVWFFFPHSDRFCRFLYTARLPQIYFSINETDIDITCTQTLFASLLMYISNRNRQWTQLNWVLFDFYMLRFVFRQNDDDWYDGLWTVQIIRVWVVCSCNKIGAMC